MPLPLAPRRRFINRTASALILLCALGGSAAGPGAQVAAPATTAPSLYERLGGYDEVARFVGLVFPRVAQHPDLTHLFRGHGRDSQQRQFQLVVELVCRQTGGPCAYIGRPMPPVHEGLGITGAHWTTFLSIIAAGMDERGYAPDVRAEFLEVWRGFRPEVVDGAAGPR